MTEKYKHKLVNLPLNSGRNGFVHVAELLCDFLNDGWELVNATSSGNGVIYILKKKVDTLPTTTSVSEDEVSTSEG